MVKPEMNFIFILHPGISPTSSVFLKLANDQYEKPSKTVNLKAKFPIDRVH